MPPMIVGHRGVAGTHPENTQASIEQAAKLGLKWIEVDIQPTLDDQLVVCHDHTLERCSDGTGRVDEHTLAELKQFDFGSWKSSEFEDEKILTLTELLALVEELDLSVNLEVKVDTRHQPAHVVELLHDELIRCSMDTDRILISSFSHRVVEEVKKHMPQYRVGMITEQLAQEDKTTVESVNAFSCHLNYANLTKADIEYLKQTGREIWCYTVNQSADFEYINHVDAIFTDFPTRFIES